MNSKKQILVVEDESIVAVDIQKTLQKLGYDVPAVVSSGQAAIQKARENKPDLVLMDIVLKGKTDGIATAKKIHNNLNIPVVYLTAYADEATLKRAKITEPFGYIIKPFETRELRTVIEMALYKAGIENELKASKVSFHNIVEKSADGIIVVDKEGVVQFANHAIEALFGRKTEELVGEQFGFPVVGGEVMELDIIRHGKEPGIAEMRVMETEWNDQKAHLALLRDITERKKAEEKLKETLKMKSEFTSMVSHELRTPLTAIKEGIALVADGLAGEINEEQKELLGISKKNVDRLARLINDVLDFQKLESGKVNFDVQLNSINEIIRDVYEMMAPTAKDTEIDLLLELDECLPQVGFDSDKITQVLTNLVTNAMKFTEKGHIMIKTSQDDDSLQVSVSDTGCGIRKKDLPRVFDKFEQLRQGGERKTGGTGLGLAISKEIIELHSGKIWVESAFGKGSKFTFTLPKYSTEELFKEHIRNVITESLKNNTKMSVLIISIADFDKLKQELFNGKTNSILKDMKALLKKNLREPSPQRVGDIVLPNFGEFFVILAVCDREGVLNIEQRLERALSEYLSHQNLVEKVTLLFGYATYPDDATADEDLIKKAKELQPMAQAALSV